MAYDRCDMRATPELAYSSTDSTGDNEALFLESAPSTPEAQTIGLAPYSDTTCFAGSQYNDYEPQAGVQTDNIHVTREQWDSLQAEIGFEGQQANYGGSQAYDQSMGFGQIQTENSTAKRPDILEFQPDSRFGVAPYMNPVETTSVIDPMLAPEYLPTYFAEQHAHITCLQCGRDPTVPHPQHVMQRPIPLPRSPLQHGSDSPISLPPRSKMRISRPPVSQPEHAKPAATCGWCGMTFSRPGGLPRHQQSACQKRPVDMKTSQFVCNGCDVTRPRKDKIQLHCRKEHKQKPGQESFTERT